MAKILIIEDTFELRESIADALRLEGYEVFLAIDGESGIKLAWECMPDLILCDILMPGMDGYDVLQALKTNFGQLPFPFIFITALSERKNFREGMELGADDYLVKPFTVYELLKAINIRLKKHQSVEKRIKAQIVKIENDLSTRIEELNGQLESQGNVIREISDTNDQIARKLRENQTQLMQETLRTIEINVTMQSLAKQLNTELQKEEITEEQRLVLTKLRNRIRNKSVLVNNWTIFQLKFNQAYPKFTAHIMSQFPHLSKQDMIIVSGIFTNLNSIQLSVILSISPESVRKDKYRLKKKLGLEKDVDLTKFIHQISLEE
ncbi:MAG: response regulator [Bacteroidia bacterium]|jgi:DNA-binding response OmpR family regulator/DNA-binding CsgD family transcriptional regulator